jgi:hypothetical protein
MNRAILTVICALALGVGGCVDEEVPPSQPEIMTAPELSRPREPRMTDDPPPPMREELQKTTSTLLTRDEPAPVQTTTHAPARLEPGVVNPLR